MGFKYCLLTVAMQLILFSCSGQDTLKLHDYLLTHRYNIYLDSPKTLDVIPAMMGENRLFVLGEGGSHDLKMYEKLKPLLLLQLAKLNLKYYFNESGRAAAYIKNKYLYNNYSERPKGFELMFSMLDKEKTVLELHPDFLIKGIDFERGLTLQLAVNHLFKNVNVEGMPAANKLLKQITDTTVTTFSFKQFEHFYRGIQRRFFEDSVNIKPEIGPLYPQFAYLLSNPNINNPNSNRNKAMANNLLNEIEKTDTTHIYFLSIGTAHSLAVNTGSTVFFLSSSKPFQGKMLVMNVFCENCNANGEALDSHRLRFMEGDILRCFSGCADMDMTIFDLRDLPAEFNSMREYGALLFYAKNQN